MKTETYLSPECQVHTWIAEQAVLTGSGFGADNAAGDEMAKDEWLQDF